MTFQIKAEVLLNNSNWEKNLRKTQNSMNSFGKSMKTIAGAVKGAIAFMGINAIGDGLMNAAKAADEDAKSMRVLNKVLDNSWKATDKQTKAVDDFIQKTSLQVGIVDDQLRPAFAKIATTIKDPTKAMQAFTIALDTSVATGKDLNVVSLAMAKFFGGQTTALDKLVPGIKNASDKMEYLKKNFSGAAEAGAGTFNRINVAMENASEAIGSKLLPYVQQFASWLGSAEGQKSLDQWISDLKQLIGLAGDFLGLLRNVTGAFAQTDKNKALTGALNTQKGNAAFNFLGGNTPTGKFALTSGQSLSKSGGNMAPITMNVTVNGVTNASQVVTELQKLAQKKGIPLSKLLK